MAQTGQTLSDINKDAIRFHTCDGSLDNISCGKTSDPLRFFCECLFLLDHFGREYQPLDILFYGNDHCLNRHTHIGIGILDIGKGKL